MKIRFQRSTLYVNDRKTLLSHAIYGLVELDEVLLVLTYGSSARQMETLPAENVYAFNEKGEQIWQIQEPFQPEGKVVSYADICLKEDRKVVVGTTQGTEYILNTKDGSVSLIKGQRPW